MPSTAERPPLRIFAMACVCFVGSSACDLGELDQGGAGGEGGASDAGPRGDGGTAEAGPAGDADAGVRDAAASADAGTATDGTTLEDAGLADPAEVSTEALCVLLGTGDVRAEGQEGLAFLGTDLGWTYSHGDQLEWLFGDTWTTATQALDPSTPSDDAFASLSLSRFPDGDAAEQGCAAGELALTLGTYEDSGGLAALQVGHVLDGFKTPFGGFRDGPDEVGLFFTGKPRGCLTDDDCDGLRCDTGLGFFGEEYFDEGGVTTACIDGSYLGCLANTMATSAGWPIADSGFCVDPGSSIADGTDTGRVASVATTMRIGLRESSRYAYTTYEWLTSRFMNPSLTTARAFEPASGTYDYAKPEADEHGTLLLFGRPQFVGVAEVGRTADLYFAYAPLPLAEAGQGFASSLRYFTHVDASGVPLFSADPLDAAALDLSGGEGDVAEAQDIVNQMSVRYVPALERFVMIYGGDLGTLPNAAYPNCGVLEYFAPGHCDDVDHGSGAMRVRTAPAPWGPWSKATPILVGGDPNDPGATTGDSQYAPGGLLRHPDCTEPTCAPHDATLIYDEAQEVGFLYGANIVEEWTEVRDGGVELYWNVSSWDPYRVMLVKTFLPRAHAP